MDIQFYGAARTVTGSKHLITVNGTRILLDCGMFQGKRQESFEQNRQFPFDAKSIDLLILSHAHIDHSGSIPNLVKQGFRGDIICTAATRDLCATMLPDSGFIQERDAEFINKQARRKHERNGHPFTPVEPIYTYDDAMACLQYFTTRNYYREVKIAPGVTLTFHDAGHMLGSAIVQLHIEDHDTNREITLVFSGDLGRKGIPIIRDPDTLTRADILIMESTYGNRVHEPYWDSSQKLEQVIIETYKRGGVVIMPAFAVGRTQQLVYTLHELMQKGDIPEIPIYVDSPLAVNATAVFQLHPECYDDEIRQFMQENRDPFGLNSVQYVRSVEDSKRINFERQPCIIISASGMAEFGRVLHHLKNRITEPQNTILITGWQAPHTLGRRLVEGVDVVRIFGEEYPRKAQVEVLNGFSGHAGQDELLAWVGAMTHRPQRTFLVHGEEDAAMAFKTSLEQAFNLRVDVPVTGQKFSV
ncbi:MAG: MBL fold metallo-hydrolase [Phototrophicales bacterium]|nr:MAG: MBL fold metallo-hydrolase [Phototrophicales bacterium]